MSRNRATDSVRPLHRRAARVGAAMLAGTAAAVALISLAPDAEARPRPRPAPESRIQLFAELDPDVPAPIDEGTEYEEPYSPHVYLSMRGGVRGRSYLLRLTREPRWDFRHPERWPAGAHCGLDTFVTTATRARGRRGSVAWGLEPATSYTPFHGTELCPGEYLGTLKERRPGFAGARAVATVLLSYPGLDLVVRPNRRARR